MLTRPSESWRFLSWPTLLGYFCFIAFALLASNGPFEFHWERTIFLLGTVIPFALYLHLTLLTSLDHQIQLYWAPFLLIAVVTFFIFDKSMVTHELVSLELRQFRSGGNYDLYVRHKDHHIKGHLILLSQEAIYIRAPYHKIDTKSILKPVTKAELNDGCVLRIPLHETLVVYQPSLKDTDDKLDDGGSGLSKLIFQRVAIPDHTKTLCGTAYELRPLSNATNPKISK